MESHKERLTALQRIQALLDPGTFHEIGRDIHHDCVRFGMQERELPYDGVITGMGKILGRPVAIYSQDFSVMGGTLGEMHGAKIARCIELAIKSRCPIIGINDSGGARIQEGIKALGGYGRIFYLNTRASGLIPQISIIAGPCAGGAVYSPGITDFVFVIESASHMFVTGPKVVKQVLYQEIDIETLGGASMHATKSGVAHFLEPSEEACFFDVRKLLSYLPQHCFDDAGSAQSAFGALSPTPGSSVPMGMTATMLANIRAVWKDRERAPDQRFVTKDITTIVPSDPKRSYNMCDVIAAVADPDTVFEAHAGFAGNIITAFARIDTRVVGIIANQPKVLAGVLDCDASDKAARFIRFCDAFGIPLVTLVDVPGFMPGYEQESRGIIRHGAKLLYAYSEASVPKVTLIIRKAYGGAYIAMCSRHLGADFVYAWPSAEIAVMGGESAVEILYRREIRQSKDPETLKHELIAEYNREFLTPNEAARSGIIDGIIEMAQTREILITSLEILSGTEQHGTEISDSTGSMLSLRKRHGNIPL